MRILLIGEYSGFYRSLKFGLKELGHEVLHISAGDGWKALDSDILISNKFSGRKAFLDIYAKYIYHVLQNRNFDFVLLINPFIVSQKFGSNDILVELLSKLNGKIILSVAGDDYFVDKLWATPDSSPLGYTWVQDSLKYDHPNYLEVYQREASKNWNTKILKKVAGVIPTSYEYYKAYAGLHERVEMIPLPFVMNNLKQLNFEEDLSILNVFHGINRAGAKGSHYILQAKEIIESKYPSDFNFSIVEKVPYAEYLNTFDNCHLFFDQVNSSYTGYNGLEGLAKNKIVLGGAEEAALSLMGTTSEKCPVVNIIPNVDDIVNKLLVLKETDKDELYRRMAEGRSYLEKYHDAIMIAKKYEEFLLKL